MFHQYKEHENGEIKDTKGHWIYATRSWAAQYADEELWKIRNVGGAMPDGGVVGRRVDFWNEFDDDFDLYRSYSGRCSTCFFTVPYTYRNKPVLTIHNLEELKDAYDKYKRPSSDLIYEALNIMTFDWEKLAEDYIAVEYIPEKEEDLDAARRALWFPGMIVVLNWRAMYPAEIPKDQICRFSYDVDIGDVVWFRYNGETKQIEVTNNNRCIVRLMWGHQFYMSPDMPGNEKTSYIDEHGDIVDLLFTPYNLEQLEAAR